MMEKFLSLAKVFVLNFGGMLLFCYLAGLVWKPDFFHDWATALCCSAAMASVETFFSFKKK